MTIGQKIIFSSTLVAILAGLAPFIGMKSTHTVRDKLVKILSETTEEIHILDDIKTQITGIQSDLHKVVREVSIGDITDVNQYFEEGKNLTQRIGVLKNEIKDFGYRHPHPITQKESEQLYSICASLLVPVQILYPREGTLPKPVDAIEAGVNTRKIVDIFSDSFQVAKNRRYEIIENEGGIVETEIGNLNFYLMWIGGLTCLMALVFGRIIASNLSTEISKLRYAATQLNNGDYSVRVGLKSQDEFGKIGQAFDGMAANLQQSKVIEKQKSEMERLNKELKIKNNSLDSFVYRVSHDLKAPVINIRALLKMIHLNMASTKNPDLTQPFFFLDKSVDKLESTIFDLLEVSRIEKNLETTKEWINLEQKLEQVKSENSENIDLGKVLITSNLKVPELYFSTPNFDSILSNIVTNGIKYRSSTRQPTIHLETEQVDNFVRLRITDNGVGIDLEKHGGKLFGMFNRFHNHVEGSGVGLYIVKKIVEDAGGKIEVESQIEKGTTFTIFFNQQNVPALLEIES